jgi:hypothetical protein
MCGSSLPRSSISRSASMLNENFLSLYDIQLGYNACDWHCCLVKVVDDVIIMKWRCSCLPLANGVSPGAPASVYSPDAILCICNVYSLCVHCPSSVCACCVQCQGRKCPPGHGLCALLMLPACCFATCCCLQGAVQKLTVQIQSHGYFWCQQQQHGYFWCQQQQQQLD